MIAAIVDPATSWMMQHPSTASMASTGAHALGDQEQNVQLLLLSIMALRLFIPSVGLFLLLCQLLQVLLRILFAHLQASSFLESHSGYQAIPNAGDPINVTSSNLRSGPSSANLASNGRISLPPDENGILPVVVPVPSIRRGLVYALFSLAIFTYIVEGALLIAHSLISMEWESHTKPSIYQYEEYHLLGTSFALFVQVLYMAWQERSLGLGKFKRVYPVLLALCVWIGEVALLAVMSRTLVILTSNASHSEEAKRLHGWTIGHLVVQATRILVLSFLLLSFTPLLRRTDYKPNEYTAILAEAEAVQGQSNGTQTPSNGAAGYGTFRGQPKKKAENGKNEENKGLNKDLSLVKRMRILGPYLWPKKSRTLQVVACELIRISPIFDDVTKFVLIACQVVCFLLLGVGRVVNVFVPRTYGNLVEDLTNKRGQCQYLANER